MAEQRIEVFQEIREQSIEVDSEPSVLHGIDGVSPIATVTQTETGAVISITDRDGTTTAVVANGQNGAQGERGEQGIAGADGFSPIANVIKTGDTATITITDKNGTTTAQIKDGTGASVTIDTALSSSSTNPVQNKVINSALNNKADASTIPTTTSQLTNDSDFVTDATYTHTDNNFTDTYKSRLDTLTDSYIVSLIEDGSEVNY